MKSVIGLVLVLLLTASPLIADGNVGTDQQIVIPADAIDWQNDVMEAENVSDAEIMAEAERELAMDPDFQKFLASQQSKGRGGLTDGQRIVLYYAGTILAHVDVWGEGNVDYWLRAWTSLRDEGNRNSKALKKFVPYMTDSYLKSTVERIADDMYTSSGGNGYVQYWLEKSESLERKLRKAGNKLLMIYNESKPKSESGPAGGIVIPDDHTGSPTNPVDPPYSGTADEDSKHILRYAGRVLWYVSVSGTGDVDYWFQAARMYHHEANRHADLLEEIANYFTDSNLRLSVKLAAQDLKLINSGHGNVDYWLSRSENLGRSMKNIGDNLCDMGGI